MEVCIEVRRHDEEVYIEAQQHEEVCVEAQQREEVSILTREQDGKRVKNFEKMSNLD